MKPRNTAALHMHVRIGHTLARVGQLTISIASLPPELQRLAEMLGADDLCALEVRDRPRHAQHAVVAARRQGKARQRGRRTRRAASRAEIAA